MDPVTIYELSLNVLAEWQAHSLSNSGTNGSIRLLPRRQLLADGTETDACSGNIAKHHHAVLLAEYFEEASVPLCPACAVRDGRRVAALVNRPDYKKMTIEQILSQCGLCDAHGFLVTAKNAANGACGIGPIVYPFGRRRGTDVAQKISPFGPLRLVSAL
jgi:CRISPR/Cas system-associated protein Cas7 (RAMP superfamily)